MTGSHTLFVSPHNDDAALFGAFTLMNTPSTVLTVFDSVVQLQRGHERCTRMVRREEDREALLGILGCAVQFGGVGDDCEQDIQVARALESEVCRLRPKEAWLPAIEDGGHPQHNQVGRIGAAVFSGLGIPVQRYLTYTSAGKSRSAYEVKAEGWMVRTKLQALACYRTQLEIDALGCWPHFMDLREYVA